MSKTSTLDLVSLSRGVGEALGEVNELENRAGALKDAINKNIAALHGAKAKVGTYRKDGTGCALATAFMDGCVAKGIAASTAQKVYLPTFKAHVASGKPVGDWNSKRKAKPAQGAAQGVGKTLAQKLATAYRDEGFSELCGEIEGAFLNDEGTVLEIIEAYLILNGALKEDEGAK